jgi:uncharacterized protein (UPF0333 family)
MENFILVAAVIIATYYLEKMINKGDDDLAA